MSLQHFNTAVAVEAKVVGVVVSVKDEVTEVTEVAAEVQAVPHEAAATKTMVAKLVKVKGKAEVALTPGTRPNATLTPLLSNPAGAIGLMAKELIFVRSRPPAPGRTSGSPSPTPNETGTSLEQKMTRTH